MLPIEDDQYVACEWIGAKNYLKERVPPSGARTRGANCTSVDAAIMFERTDGKRQIVLIEWKYTESYVNICLTTAKSKRDRTAIYRPMFDASQCPIDRAPLPDFESLFYEPFYQFMRQQFLAHEMELANEQGADIVTVLHIAPAHNRAFHRVTSPQLALIDRTATGVWSKLAGDRFISVNTEELFGPALRVGLVGMMDWSDYVLQRYPWVGKPGLDSLAPAPLPHGLLGESSCLFRGRTGSVTITPLGLRTSTRSALSVTRTHSAPGTLQLD
jgi:hypothetical protein